MSKVHGTKRFVWLLFPGTEHYSQHPPLRKWVSCQFLAKWNSPLSNCLLLSCTAILHTNVYQNIQVPPYLHAQSLDYMNELKRDDQTELPWTPAFKVLSVIKHRCYSVVNPRTKLASGIWETNRVVNIIPHIPEFLIKYFIFSIQPVNTKGDNLPFGFKSFTKIGLKGIQLFKFWKKGFWATFLTVIRR